jgi:thiamine-monophosphate kinase
MTKEEQLIERFRQRVPSRHRGLRVGIGDDAAVLEPAEGKEWVITTDAFLENVHFLRKVHPPEAAGYKALARATSDIAAMGARARYFFLTFGFPDDLAGAWLDDFLEGMARAARRFNLTLAGGDTTKYPVVVASLTVLGEIDRGRAILRSGARPGDLLCVSGRLGQAELGLRLVQRKLHKRKLWAGLLKKQFYPEPRLKLGEWLAAHRLASSMIDTSDGLSTDLGHICSASGVGATLWMEKIPVVKVAPGLQRLGLDPFDMALNGGEDYELLFTVPKKIASRLPHNVVEVPITVIGEITREKDITLMDEYGHGEPFKPGGWDPFLKAFLEVQASPGKGSVAK